MVNFAFFDSNEHTMHAERDAVLTIPSVHLSVSQSVCLSSVLCLNEWIYIWSHLFDTLVGASFQFFELYRRYEIPIGTPSAGAINRWGEKNTIFIFYLENCTR